MTFPKTETERWLGRDHLRKEHAEENHIDRATENMFLEQVSLAEHSPCAGAGIHIWEEAQYEMKKRHLI